MVKLVNSYGIGCIKSLPKFVTGMYFFCTNKGAPGITEYIFLSDFLVLKPRGVFS